MLNGRRCKEPEARKTISREHKAAMGVNMRRHKPDSPQANSLPFGFSPPLIVNRDAERSNILAPRVSATLMAA
jgi:hypothetical protein